MKLHGGYCEPLRWGSVLESSLDVDARLVMEPAKATWAVSFLLLTKVSARPLASLQSLTNSHVYTSPEELAYTRPTKVLRSPCSCPSEAPG